MYRSRQPTNAAGTGNSSRRRGFVSDAGTVADIQRRDATDGDRSRSRVKFPAEADETANSAIISPSR